MSIVERSDDTLRRLEQNDPKLRTSLSIANRGHTTGHTSDTCFWLHDSADVLRLGNAIANNTHLERIVIHNCSEWTLDTKSLFEGLQQSTSVKELWLRGGIGIGVLNEFVANNSNLTKISIQTCDLRNGVARALSQTIKKCQNLNHLNILNCKLDNESLKEFALGIKGLSWLQELHMWNYSSINSIDIEGARAIGSLLQDLSGSVVNLKLYNVGFNHESIQICCESIATLLQDSTCNLTELDLSGCSINDESVAAIVGSLIGNTKLKQLVLSNNNIGRSGCESIGTLLQDTNSNINKISLSGCEINVECAALLAQALVGNIKLKCVDLSQNSMPIHGWYGFIAILNCSRNHTLCSLGCDEVPTKLTSLLKLNRAVDMEPLFKLDTDDDERNPKVLPSVIDWFDRRVRESNEDGKVVKSSIEARKLSSIFQFARAMPLEFVPSPSDVSLLHKEARDQLVNKKMELESQIATMIKAKEEVEHKIKVKDRIIKDRLEVSDSIGSLTKKRKHGL